MKNPRIILRTCLAIAALAAIPFYSSCKTESETGTKPEKKSEARELQKFKLGAQAWTFNRMTFVEMLDELDRLGIRYVQAYRKQKLGEGFGKDEVFHHTMKPETREKVLALLKKKNITLTSYGVITAEDKGKNMEDWKQIFEFAKAIGLRDISTEPGMAIWPEVLPTVAKLAKEYGIGVGIHNHANPNAPATYMERLKDYDEVIKITPDTGHWARSGFDPVEGLRAVAGRIQSLHIKDLTGMKPVDVKDTTRKIHDVPWGTGALNFAGQLLELRRQGFDGIVYLEYEHRTPNILKEVELCVQYFRLAEKATDEELLKNAITPPGYTSAEKTVDIQRKQDSGLWPSPQPLFKNDLSDADFKPGSWEMKDGVLTLKGGGDIWTKEDYGDFALTGEFKCEEKTNSGIFIRCSDTVNWLHNAIEFQILQGDAENPTHLVGAMFDCQEPSRQVEIESGKWYRFVVTAKGGELNFFLDGEHLNRIRLNQWKEVGKNPDGTPNKFNKAYKDMAKSGKIGFQDHKSPVAFRNLKIEKF